MPVIASGKRGRALRLIDHQEEGPCGLLFNSHWVLTISSADFRPIATGGQDRATYPLVPNMVRRHLMGRRLYYRDSCGRVQRDRRAERRGGGGPGLPMKPFIFALMILAAFIVLHKLNS